MKLFLLLLNVVFLILPVCAKEAPSIDYWDNIKRTVAETGFNGTINTFHFHRLFTKPNDMRSHSRGFCTTSTGEKCLLKVASLRSPRYTAAVFAPHHRQFTMHMQDLFRPTSLVQIVHVLSDQQQRVHLILEPRHRSMSIVGLHLQHLAPTSLVKFPHETRVGQPCFRCGHVLNSVVLPQPIVISERPNARFSRDARSRQHDHA